MNTNNLNSLSKYLRSLELRMTTTAGSGHPTSSLSATDLLGYLISEVFRYDGTNPQNPANDRLIFSKGHATPLYYSLFIAMGLVDEKEMYQYRKMGSMLEGHPTFRFPFAEAATGSLGQGLSVGVGISLALSRLSPQLLKSPRLPKDTAFKDKPSSVYVLLGDGEMAEGSVWEAMEIASYYKLNNLVAIVDVNRLGQTQETMQGHKTEAYEKRAKAFGWETIVIDGHDFNEIEKAFTMAGESRDKPFMIIAKTIKGKGVSFLEDKEGWHGKPLPADLLEKALIELGEVKPVQVKLRKPVLSAQSPKLPKLPKLLMTDYNLGDSVATRKAYGNALKRLGSIYNDMVVLDAETKNSTYAEDFLKAFPERYFEMFIAEQNMVGTAVGFSRMGYIPFASTFASFFTRAFDQIRMSALSGANIKFCGSHAGVSIGEDGPSQMGLEDIAMFRSVQGSTVFYPSDAVSTEKLVEEMVKNKGIFYLRASRPATPVIYANNEEFTVGGSKIHRVRSSTIQQYSNVTIKHKIVIVAAGVTLFEALKAQDELLRDGIESIVVDCYSIKPIDAVTLKNLGKETDKFITVEDHWFDGGLGDAVLNAFNTEPMVQIHKLAVTKFPFSAKPAELLAFMKIDAKAIIEKAREILA